MVRHCYFMTTPSRLIFVGKLSLCLARPFFVALSFSFYFPLIPFWLPFHFVFIITLSAFLSPCIPISAVPPSHFIVVPSLFIAFTYPIFLFPPIFRTLYSLSSLFCSIFFVLLPLFSLTFPCLSAPLYPHFSLRFRACSFSHSLSLFMFLSCPRKKKRIFVTFFKLSDAVDIQEFFALL